ncbi:MAG: hypothetical protein ABSE51_15510 [Terracidiphilus sp.]
MGYFTGKILQTEAGDVQVTPAMAKAITRYLIKNDYTDDDDKITAGYHDAKAAGTIAPLPPELAAYSAQILQLIDSVFSDSQLPLPEDDRKSQRNKLNANFQKKEFQSLWNRFIRDHCRNRKMTTIRKYCCMTLSLKGYSRGC